MENIFPQNWRVIFKIGELDYSPNEFALAPSDAKQFKNRFPQDPIFVVGKSKESEFPFIHPNEKDTFWGGEPLHKFKIRFRMDEEPSGIPLIFIALYDVHESFAPLMDVFLNDELVQTIKVAPGMGRAFYGDKGEEQFIAIPLEKEKLRIGDNEIAISLRSGSWVAYDAIFLIDAPKIEIPPVGKREESLSLYRKLSTLEMRSKGICLNFEEAFQCLFFPGDFLETDFQIENGDWEIKMDVYVSSTKLIISYTPTEEGAKDAWDFELSIPESNWYHLKIRNLPDKALLELTNEEGKLLKKDIKQAIPIKQGKLRITAQERIHFYLTNLFFRPPIRLQVDRIAYKKGDIASLLIEISPLGIIPFEIKLLSPSGEELYQEKIDLSPTRSKVERYFTIDERFKDGEYKIICDIPFNGRSLWKGEISLCVEDGKACDVLKEIEQLEKKGFVADWLEEVKYLYWIGDFYSALALLQRMKDVKKEGKAYHIVGDGEVILGNDYFEIKLKTKGGFGPYFLLDKRSGRLFADSPYIYFLNKDIQDVPKFKDFKVEKERFYLLGELGDVEILQEFFIPDDKPYFEERIRLRNKGDKTIPTENIFLGLCKKLNIKNGVLEEGWSGWRAVSVPYRRPLLGRVGEYDDYPFEELFWRKGHYCPSFPQKVYTEELGAEGWILTDGKHSLLVAKHNNDGMEYSTLRILKGENGFYLCFAGGGVWHGDPEAATSLEPGETLWLGTTRIVFLQGGWQEGYYAFREFMEENGHIIPKNYNPPIHWNELYDNPLWWNPDTPENRKKYYSLPQILEEAEKAKEIGCEALYLDPGWDTSFASSIWAEDRLLKVEEFVKLMKEKYGLSVALHTPLAGWSDINAYPVECRRKDAQGNVLPALCGGSELYIRTKAERLIRLAQAGVVFFMFDGSAFTGDCYDESHGHPIPYTREAHCRAILKLAQLIHSKFPDVLIELHDPIIAGVPERYAPTYYLHGLPGSFDEVWAFEYMWSPLEDLLSGRAISLYYYNLAYSLPLYIHIDLRKDNEHCLEFWWYASTCRHLGIGGKHPNERIWQAHKLAMKEYKRLKPFYTIGRFYGLDETVHIHSLKNRGAVINVFNLQDKPARKHISFKLDEIGLESNAEYEVKGVEWQRQGGEINLYLDLPPFGTALIEVSEVKK
ncbi:hypothetical protein H5T87_02910 [bacterium]|nr:hypothetical protein [bacterium]